MTPDQLASSVEDIILKAVEDFNEGLSSSQTSAYNRMIGLIKQLDLDKYGNIKKTAQNVKVLKGVNKSIEETLLTDTYKTRVSKYLGTYDKLEGQQDLYFEVLRKAVKSTAEPSTVMLELIKQQSIDAAVSNLLETGITQNFATPIKDILIKNITSGGSFSTLNEEMRAFIIGDEQTAGRFLSYTKQITQDSLSTYNATYNKAVTDTLGLQFYKYVGGLKDSSRPFCEEKNGKYFHREEIRLWADEKWEGKMRGTNSATIFINRGGYRCNHQLIAVSEAVVPDTVKDRVREKGYLET